jgi:hypothetical protein
LNREVLFLKYNGKKIPGVGNSDGYFGGEIKEDQLKNQEQYIKCT